MGKNVSVNIDTKKIMKEVEKNAKEQLKKKLFDIECPHCKANIQLSSGLSKCPKCGEKIDLNLDIKF